jgi:general stress protein 26
MQSSTHIGSDGLVPIRSRIDPEAPRQSGVGWNMSCTVRVVVNTTRSDVDKREELSGDEAIGKVRALLPRFKTAMLVTIASDGGLHARPLAPAGEAEAFVGTLWFFVDDRSLKAHESAGGATVAVLFQNDEDNVYLHLRGTSKVARDLSKMQELYSPVLKTWFPKGLDDPHLVLITVEAESGVYWEVPGGRLRAAAALAASFVTGTPTRSTDAGNLDFTRRHPGQT